MPTVVTNGIETHYERRGDGSPIVLVHAAALDHAQWASQVEALSDEYATIAYDVRGHGRTGGSTEEEYSIDLFADDLEAFVTALELEFPVVCGHSMGGCIAQAYAARHPDRLAGLVLADTFTPGFLSRGERLQRSVLLRATIPPVRLLGYERVERAMVWLHERLQRGSSGDYGEIERLRAAGPRMETEEFAKVIRAVASFHETDVDLASITVPTLVLYGENGPAFVRGHAAKLAASLPDVVVREVPGAGHASNLDEPEFFTHAVGELLARADSRDASGAPDGSEDGRSR